MKKSFAHSTPFTTPAFRTGWGSAATLALSLLAVDASRADVWVFDAFAGHGIALDHTDGTGANARFFNPTSVAVDASGTVYVADGGDHTVRKITAGGVVTTVAGSSGQAGSLDGAGSNARFVYPYAIATDGSGNLYVTDIGDHTVRKITAGGNVTTLAGRAGVAGSLDGTGPAASFSAPQGIAVDVAGNVYVGDTNNSTIRKIAPTGIVTTFAGVAAQPGTANGVGAAARFNFPFGLAVDAAGNVLVADHGNSAIRRITAGGTVTTLAGSAGVSGNLDGSSSAARFDHPAAVAVDASGNVYVSDTSNQTIRRIANSTGNVTTLAGTAGLGGRVDGAGAAARFFYPFGIAATSNGTVYVADTGNHTVRVVASGGAVTTLAGATGAAGTADGTGGSASFGYPDGMAVDAAGTLYVADHNNQTIRKITAAGAVSTLAGAAGISGSADGPGGVARFSGPAGVAVDGLGNVYVADANNATIRKISSGGSVTTFAGVAGVTGSTDGIGGSARFNAPRSLAVDGAGNVYVADTNNNTVRKITAGGRVTTLAGAAGQVGSADGVEGSARFNGPYAVALDSVGNAYVADFFNSTIRQISPGGTVTTLAGLAGHSGATDGAGSAARFNQSYGLAVDSGGNVFVSDTYNRAIRRVTAGGSVSTLNGTRARFFYPQGIALDASGNVYVADGDNQAISKGVLVVTPQNGHAVDNRAIVSGQSTTFSVGSAAVLTTYQWQVSADAGGTWSSLVNDATVSGATTPTLTISNATLGMNAYRFRSQVSNVAGSATSGAGTLSVVAPGTPTITTQPISQAPPAGGAFTLTAAAAATGGNPVPTFQWQLNGANIAGATGAALTLENSQPANTGVYTAVITSGAGNTSELAIVGLLTAAKVTGAGTEVAANIYVAANNNTFDQVLLQGAAETITADVSLNQITRTSFVDLNNDIVQVEFSGAGTLSLVLDAPTGPAIATNYNQPGTRYMKGHAGIVIVGANETTNVSVFSVGPVTAVSQALFLDGVTYDGVADIAYIAIYSTNGKFGGVRTANTSYFAAQGITGLYAPGVQFGGPVLIGEIDAHGTATPTLIVGSAADTHIAGGSLSQTNGQPVKVSGITHLRFVNGTTSHGVVLPAQVNQAVLRQDGANVTAQIVVNPAP